MSENLFNILLTCTAVFGTYAITTIIIGAWLAPTIDKDFGNLGGSAGEQLAIANLQMAINNKNTAEVITETGAEVLKKYPDPIKTTAEVIKETIAQDPVQAALAQCHAEAAQTVAQYVNDWSTVVVITLALSRIGSITRADLLYWIINPFFTGEAGATERQAQLLVNKITNWNFFGCWCGVIATEIAALAVAIESYIYAFAKGMVNFNSWWYGGAAKELQVKDDMLIKKATDANAQQRKIKLEAEIKLATKNHTKSLF